MYHDDFDGVPFVFIFFILIVGVGVPVLQQAVRKLLAVVRVLRMRGVHLIK